MKEIKLAYSELFNAGDLLNKDLIEKLSGRRVIRSKVYDADMIAIGGALFGIQYSDKFIRKFTQKTLQIVYGNKPLFVWGSGFLYDHNQNGVYRENLKVTALRGTKTQEKLSYLTKKEYNVPLADAGLLIDIFLPNKVEKKYEIGLIPHFSQQNDSMMQKLLQRDDVHFIDIMRTPQEVIADIASCECIMSSSLHGLIFADSLHIPSLHILGETALPGGNFKFEDYYSCYGLEDKPFLITDILPTKRDVITAYRIDADVVNRKKKELLECFPKF